MYNYGYPSNLGEQDIPVAWASPIWGSGNPDLFRMECASAQGYSGSPFLVWGTEDVYATSNGLLREDRPWGSGDVAVPAFAQHYWHDLDTFYFGQGAT